MFNLRDPAQLGNSSFQLSHDYPERANPRSLSTPSSSRAPVATEAAPPATRTELTNTLEKSRQPPPPATEAALAVTPTLFETPTGRHYEATNLSRDEHSVSVPGREIG